MIVIGIDPGVSGGWAVLQNRSMDPPYDYAITACDRAPTTSYGKKRTLCAPTLFDKIEKGMKRQRAHHCVIEHVAAMPAQGVASSFMFGLSTGVAHGVGWGLAEQVSTVTPKQWKKHFGLGTDKRESLDLARQRFPEHKSLWLVLANNGIAEAALMALWWLETRREASE